MGVIRTFRNKNFFFKTFHEEYFGTNFGPTLAVPASHPLGRIVKQTIQSIYLSFGLSLSLSKFKNNEFASETGNMCGEQVVQN